MLFKSNLKGEGRTFEVRVERGEIGQALHGNAKEEECEKRASRGGNESPGSKGSERTGCSEGLMG